MYACQQQAAIDDVHDEVDEYILDEQREGNEDDNNNEPFESLESAHAYAVMRHKLS